MKQKGYVLVELVVIIAVIGITIGSIMGGVKWFQNIQFKLAVGEVENALIYVRQAAVKTGQQYNLYCFSNRVLVRQGVNKPIYTIRLSKGIKIPDNITGKHLIFRGSKASSKTGTITLINKDIKQRADITVYIATGKVAVKYKSL